MSDVSIDFHFERLWLAAIIATVLIWLMLGRANSMGARNWLLLRGVIALLGGAVSGLAI